MAKSSDSETTLAWSTMWSAWRSQPASIQNMWMFGKNGLCEHLKVIMVDYTDEVKEEVFSHAPKDVQKYFGYKPKVTGKVAKKSTYNENYRSQLLEQLRGMKA